ncbi:unnamed protein product [Periconia digitata]|uniref:F-box domain-containing protein n=1 Tax=Periconia digitata TaxID=1303443 RepID=A0A9W4U8G2_9PLEO|nr:unnamed protein product [Periconia digitata]
MSLLHLPAELVVSIVAHLAQEKETLCSLARTCHLLQNECEKHIYTTINLLSTDDLRDIIDAFDARPERIASVQNLHIAYSYHAGLQATLQERMHFNAYLHKMKALRSWYVESPFDNFRWNENGGHEWVEQDMEEFCTALHKSCSPMANPQQPIGLSKLEKLVIHSHGPTTDFWRLGGFHCLFRHSTLRSLHASCFILPSDLPELEGCGPTPLTELTLDECILNPKSLGRILRTPKSLKHLTLGENVYNINGATGPSQNLTLKPLEAMEALAAVSHSLESLTHNDPQRRHCSDIYRSNPVKGDGLRNFHQLKFLDIDPCSFLHQWTSSHAQAPPNLETLRIHFPLIDEHDLHSDHSVDSFEELPPLEPYTRISSLKSLEIVQGAFPVTHKLNAQFICERELLCERHAYAYKLFKHGINLKVYVEPIWRMGLIPPYLHGEQKPTVLCIYDAAEVGFHRHIVDEVLPPPSLMGGIDLFLASDDASDVTNAGSVQSLDSPRSNTPTQEQTASPAPKTSTPSTEPPPETDQLNQADIISIRNKVQRLLDADLDRVASESDDSESDDRISMSSEFGDEGGVVFGFHMSAPHTEDSEWMGDIMNMEDWHDDMEAEFMAGTFMPTDDELIEEVDDWHDSEEWFPPPGMVAGPPSAEAAAVALAIEMGMMTLT